MKGCQRRIIPCYMYITASGVPIRNNYYNKFSWALSCVSESFPEYAIVTCVLGTMLVVVSLAACFVYR